LTQSLSNPISAAVTSTSPRIATSWAPSVAAVTSPTPWTSNSFSPSARKISL
jgi:hypothetical protein